ncbi:unnamed protein product [Nesidiocoris tenuis]|uniref:Uncharacterized protein n=1 Tax=Nesidiocoris tenuis TaxID=355587 RepID=A0A6H5GYY3_9HEMI|nr:unnamed protein product [Nesidiocoris tenuis]
MCRHAEVRNLITSDYHYALARGREESPEYLNANLRRSFTEIVRLHRFRFISQGRHLESRRLSFRMSRSSMTGTVGIFGVLSQDFSLASGIVGKYLSYSRQRGQLQMKVLTIPHRLHIERRGRCSNKSRNQLPNLIHAFLNLSSFQRSAANSARLLEPWKENFSYLGNGRTDSCLQKHLPQGTSLHYPPTSPALVFASSASSWRFAAMEIPEKPLVMGLLDRKGSAAPGSECRTSVGRRLRAQLKEFAQNAKRATGALVTPPPTGTRLFSLDAILGVFFSPNGKSSPRDSCYRLGYNLLGDSSNLNYLADKISTTDDSFSELAASLVGSGRVHIVRVAANAALAVVLLPLHYNKKAYIRSLTNQKLVTIFLTKKNRRVFGTKNNIGHDSSN